MHIVYVIIVSNLNQYSCTIWNKTTTTTTRHLDSVGPDTRIRDIVDRCRVWECHAEDLDSWGGLPGIEWKYGQ